MVNLSDGEKIAKRICQNNLSLQMLKIKVMENPKQVWGESLDPYFKKMKGGFYPDSNLVVVFTDNHENIKELENTFKHEILGHLGLKLLGEEKRNKILDSILEAKEGSYVNNKLNQVESVYTKITDKRMLAEEVFASIAEDASTPVPLNNPTTNIHNLSTKEDVLSVVDLIKRDLHYGYMDIKGRKPRLAQDELPYGRFGLDSDEDVMIAAEASRTVYNDTQVGTDLLTPITEDELRFYKVLNRENPKTGFRSSFNFDNHGNVIMALKGTSSFKDWRYGNIQGIGLYPAQYREAAILAKQAHKAFGDSLKITGHSLGGGLATLSSAITNRPAITFNSAGIHPNSLLNNQLDYSKFSDYAEKGGITRCIVKGEILNLLQDYSPLPNSMGLREDLEHPNNPSTFTKHKMVSVEEALQHEINKRSLRDAILQQHEPGSLVELINKETDSSVLSLLRENKEPVVMAALGKNKHTPLDMLVALSKSPIPETRLNVASNESFPVEALFSMRKDKHSGVQKVVNDQLYNQTKSESVALYTPSDKEAFISKIKAENAEARSIAQASPTDQPSIGNKV